MCTCMHGRGPVVLYSYKQNASLDKHNYIQGGVVIKNQLLRDAQLLVHVHVCVYVHVRACVCLYMCVHAGTGMVVLL